MSDSNRNGCSRPANHHLHICQLKKQGLKEEVSSRTDNPGYICHNCNAIANQAEDLCNCSPILKKS